uniref:Phosphoinositide phospholipase C n=1 Tax=Dendroctonus ponderosae TaxID=77166 RepID=A0AAR5Q1K1_DENPD
MSTPIRPASGVRHSVPGRTSSIISNASSSSFNDDFSDDDYDDEDDEDNMEDKTIHTILAPTDSPRTFGSHAVSKTSSTKRSLPTDDKLRKKGSQISKELSDLVVYIQAIKFRGLNNISPNSSVKQRPKTCVSISGSSIVTTGSSSASNISSSGIGSESDSILYENEVCQDKKLPRPNLNYPCYQCSSINENTAKKLCRKQPLALVAHTQTQLMRTYPAPMRIDSSNFNPVIFWSFGIQMAALNFQTEDTPMQLHNSLFETNGKCGYVSKPRVMWDKSHVMYRRFNPWDKQFDGIHSSQFIVSVLSGQYVCQANVNVSVYVEVEIIGIQVDCAKQRTKVVPKNALNPIWNETFHFRVMFQDLTFVRFSVTDSTNNHLLSQRIVPLRCLRPGYRHMRLKNAQNRDLNMSTLFIYSRIEEESLENTENREDPQTESDSKESDSLVAAVGTPICGKRKMFFLVVYGVLPDEEYTILKIIQESTTLDVLTLCLQRSNTPLEKLNDYILVEEVPRSKGILKV